MVKYGEMHDMFQTKLPTMVLSAGVNHTVVCTAEGQVLTFGDGQYGQLGHGDDGYESVPRLVENM